MILRGGMRRLKPREKRLVFLLLIVIGMAAWKFVPRPWKPTVTFETSHYRIMTTANREQADKVARVVEIQYAAYSNRFQSLPNFQRAHPKLQMKLYKDRQELRRINPGLGWAEAFYRKPYCYAYYSAGEMNPYHWMLHEATHQLNEEVAHVNPAQWLEEGLAEYFSTSRFEGDQLVLGTIDANTYPVWWIDELATTPDLKTNIQNGSVIPLRAIVTGRGGPGMRRHFNLYYLHWWTLTHFLFEDERYRDKAFVLLQQGADPETFEQLIGPIEQIQPEWHRHVLHLKSVIAGHDPQFLKFGRIPRMTNSIEGR